MLVFYQLISYLFLPLIKLNIYLRILNNKEDKGRYTERFGITSKKRPKGKLLWIHTASVGEFKSAGIIINKLYKKSNILITTTTLSASNYAIKNFGDKIIHQYAPFDISFWVKRFLNTWKPSAVVWIESDLWPTTLSILNKKSTKSILLNSRISPKSFKRWNYIKKFFKDITNTFDQIFAQSLLDKKRLEFLTKRKINYIGNLKLASIDKTIDKEKFTDHQKKLKKFKILLLASTHSGEEKILLNLIKKYLSKFKNLKIIIAPRHPERSISILNLFNNAKISSNILDHSVNLTEDVLIVNSFGQMSLYYALSDIVLLGGSFTKMGGHNPIEPAYNNCVVITGPHIYNWQNVFMDMEKNNACIICKNVSKIDEIINNLLTSEKKINSLKNLAKKFSEIKFFEINKLFIIIEKYLGYK